jgi:hypothetical protein
MLRANAERLRYERPMSERARGQVLADMARFAAEARASNRSELRRYMEDVATMSFRSMRDATTKLRAIIRPVYNLDGSPYRASP